FHRRVQALIVDQAHCIGEWGEGFHPMYKQLHRLRMTRTFNVIWNSLSVGYRPFW
ncbi:hypothetical protein DFH08DRAFT_633868, partial [Mycena albidolilacea]